MASKIEWTGSTWNPIGGCSVVSPGCTNCYAMRMAARLGRMGQERYAGLTRDTKAGPVWTGEMRLVESALTLPLRTRKQTTWFVNSMSDLFHESLPDAWIDRVFAVMALCPQHTFQVLTKRSARMRAYMANVEREALWMNAVADLLEATPELMKRPHAILGRRAPWLPLPNVWLGVSAEDQRRADERVPDLLATPAAIRFLSAEPLLGPSDFGPWIPTCYECGASCGLRLPGRPQVERCTECGEECGPDTEPVFSEGCPKCSGELDPVCPDCGHYMVYQHPDTPNLDWIIVGGESGPSARPMHPDWAREIRDQCESAKVPFFFKQWGAWAPGEAIDRAQTRTETGATLFAGHWAEMQITVRAGAELHIDDEPDVWRVGKKAAGRNLDGRVHDAMPGAGHAPG